MSGGRRGELAAILNLVFAWLRAPSRATSSSGPPGRCVRGRELQEMFDHPKLSDESKQAILYDNAVRFYGKGKMMGSGKS